MPAVPDLRLSLVNSAPPRPGGEFVLYWMMAARRTTWNFALGHAVAWAARLAKPLVILEDLRSGRRWDSDRLHRFVLDGMADNARRLQGRPVAYYPYVEPEAGAAAGLVPALGALAAVVVTDRFPCGPCPGLVEEAARQVAVRMEQVDSSGLVPLLAADREFKTAFSFRAFLQKHLPEHLGEFPQPDPLAALRLPVPAALPAAVTKRWPKATGALLAGRPAALARLEIDHRVGPSGIAGGSTAAETALQRFLSERLDRYAAGHNHPDDDATSGLSPYLHFGHISAHQVFSALANREGWSAADLAASGRGKREGWWGMGADAEAFLDQVVTWREIGYNLCDRRRDYDGYAALPAWARQTLADHARDRRPYLYTREALEAGRTHDRLWNAAQMQLAREGRLHNYLRMLWGKKILEWSRSPQEALETMIELNNVYALDGRNPNSYTGILWVLGRYDRPWGPERPVFGKVRYMTSESAMRKLRLRKYLATYASRGEGEP